MNKELADEPVAYVTGTYAGYYTFAPVMRSAILPVGMALYTSQPDQSARIAELAADGVRLMETITELRSQLAALQAMKPVATVRKNPMYSVEWDDLDAMFKLNDGDKLWSK